MRRSPLFWLGAALALAGLAWGIERLVVTDREAIEAVVEEAARAAGAADLGALEGLLTGDFEGPEARDRERTVAWVAQNLRRHRPTAIEATARDLEVAGDDASGVLRVAFHALGRPFRVDVPATFRREADGWRIASAASPRWALGTKGRTR